MTLSADQVREIQLGEVRQECFDRAMAAFFRPDNPATGAYGNLYGDLLDYVISAALIFYILTIAGVFRLRRTRPDAARPYRAFGYPIVPALYIVGTWCLLLALPKEQLSGLQGAMQAMQAMAVKAGMANSAVATANYTIN